MANRDSMLWNKWRMGSCKASKIRTLNIYEGADITDRAGIERGVHRVTGWFDNGVSFEFGSFPSLEEARAFVVDLHNQIAKVQGE